MEICVSIANCTVGECVKALAGQEMAEIRMDSISGLKPEDVRGIFSRKTRLIATCRPGGMGEEGRKKLLLAAIGAGAAYVDIEVEAPDGYKKEIIAAARARKCQVIVSFHDYKKTPVREELEQTIGWCFESGADIAKIACMVNGGEDAARLLGLLDHRRRLVVIGMGEKGRITRVAAPLLGSEIAYASTGKGKESAPGQIEEKELERLMKAMGNGRED